MKLHFSKQSWSRVRLYLAVAAALAVSSWIVFSGTSHNDDYDRITPGLFTSADVKSEISADDELSNADVRARAKAAVLGAFVADAAAMPLHWIYSPQEINNVLNGAEAPFLDPPQSPFYKAPLGSFSPFGFEALSLLRSVHQRGGVKGPELTQDLAAAFKGAQGTVYLNGASKQLLANVEGGQVFPDAAAQDNQLHSLVKVPVVVARYVGLPELPDQVLEATRSHQKSADAEQFALLLARLLESAILGTLPPSGLLAALPEALASLAASAAAGGMDRASAAVTDAMPRLRTVQQGPLDDVTQAIQDFGPSCHLPDSFLGALAALAPARPYAAAVESNIRAGGDSAGRSHVVGSMAAALQGDAAIPAAWKAKVTQLPEVERLVEGLLSQRFDDVD